MFPATWTNRDSRVAFHGGNQCKAGCTPDGNGKHRRCNCMWFMNWTFVPEGEPLTIGLHKNSKLATYSGGMVAGYDHYAASKHPWTAPGTAPVDSPCGVDGGNKRGCWTGWYGYGRGPGNRVQTGGGCTSNWPGCYKGDGKRVQCGGGSYDSSSEDWDARKMHFPDAPITVWAAGSAQEVGWGVWANHGGGYAYRLCKLGYGGRTALTEECFQQGHLNFSSDKYWLQYKGDTDKRVEVDLTELTDDGKPLQFEGKTGPWRRNPIPACKNWGGVGWDNCETWFDPPKGAPEAYGFGFGRGRRDAQHYLIIDKVQVPADLTPGDYVLSWRYDGHQTPQVWLGCSNIRVMGGNTSESENHDCDKLNPGLACKQECPSGYHRADLDSKKKCEDIAKTTGRLFSYWDSANTKWPKGCWYFPKQDKFWFNPTDASEAYANRSNTSTVICRGAPGTQNNLWPGMCADGNPPTSEAECRAHAPAGKWKQKADLPEWIHGCLINGNGQWWWNPKNKWRSDNGLKGERACIRVAADSCEIKTEAQCETRAQAAGWKFSKLPSSGYDEWLPGCFQTWSRVWWNAKVNGAGTKGVKTVSCLPLSVDEPEPAAEPQAEPEPEPQADSEPETGAETVTTSSLSGPSSGSSSEPFEGENISLPDSEKREDTLTGPIFFGPNHNKKMLVSANGVFLARLEIGKGFVVRKKKTVGDKIIWTEHYSSGCFEGKNCSNAYKVGLQPDGNLVIRDEHDVALWASHSSLPQDERKGPYRLIMQDDGNLVMFDSNFNDSPRQNWESRSKERNLRADIEASSAGCLGGFHLGCLLLFGVWFLS